MEKEHQKLKFNVIYVKGTVELLLPLLITMLKRTTCDFRLVSNGCTEQEEAILKRFVETDKRFTFYSFKSDSILRHHFILNELLFLDDSEYFAFIDSDMLADGDFTKSLLEELKTVSAVTTGLPIWHEEKDWVMKKEYNVMGGKYLRSHHNLTLGVTYCAIYDRNAAQQFMNMTGIKFDIYRWQDIPIKYRKLLEKLELKKDFYDTGKVFNILWQQYGGIVSYKATPELIHLGGISGDSDLGAFSNRIRHFIISNLPLKISGIIRSIYSRDFKLSIAESTDICYLAYRRRLTQRFFRNRILDNGQIKPNYKKLTKAYIENLNNVAKKVKLANQEYCKTIDQL